VNRTGTGRTGDGPSGPEERPGKGVADRPYPPTGAIVTAAVAVGTAPWLGAIAVGSGTAVVGLAGGLGLAAATRLLVRGNGGAARGAVAGAVGVAGLTLAALGVALAVVAADGRMGLWLAGPALVWTGLAAGLSGTDAIGSGGVSAAGRRLSPAVGAVWLAVIVLSPITNGLATLSAGVDLIVAVVYADGIAALLVVPLLVVAAAALARKALLDLPVVGFVPPGRDRRRTGLATGRDAAVRALGAASVGALLALMVGPFLVIPLFGTPTALADALPWPVGPAVGGVLLAPAVRTLLVGLAVLAAVALVVAAVRTDPAGFESPGPGARAAPAVGAVGVTVLFAAVAAATGAVDRLRSAGAIEEFLASTPLPEAPAALALSGLALAALTGLVLVGATVLAVGAALPRRVAGPALAGTGTFALAGTALLAAGTATAAAVGTVAAMIVWDAGEHAVTLRAEVGRGTARLAELVHLGSALAVGVGALAGLVVLDRAVGAVAPREALPSFALALVLALAAGTTVLFVLDG